MYFSNSPIDPLTSIMAITTAFDWYLIVGSHTLKRRSSDLISLNLASPLAALRFRFSMMVRFLSRLVRGPFLRTSVKRTASVCSSCWLRGFFLYGVPGQPVLCGAMTSHVVRQTCRTLLL